jgi:transformation/transcription domain-associated protein
MSKTMEGPSELWTMRKQFATQLAAVNVMTYVFCLSGRNPGRFAISRETGKISMTDLVPRMFTVVSCRDVTDSAVALSQQQCAYYCGELVPFRFTPNLQKFVGPIHTEGILTTGMMAIGRALTEPEVTRLCILRFRPSDTSFLRRTSRTSSACSQRTRSRRGYAL